MGTILSSAAFAGNVDTLLRNLTRRLDSFSIAGLLDDLAADINQSQQGRGPNARRVVAAELGELSMLHLIEFLRVQGLVSYYGSPRTSPGSGWRPSVRRPVRRARLRRRRK